MVPTFVFSFTVIFDFLEFNSSCVLQNRNPRDPISWASTSQIPLPDDKIAHYNSDIRPGMEKWHEPVEQPFSGEETFEWPTYNDRVHAPDGTFRPAYVCHMRTKIKYSNDKMWYIGKET